MTTAIRMTPEHPLYVAALGLRFQAVKEHGNIKPCNLKSFESCFTVFRNKLQFWFNDPTGSTRLLSEEIPPSLNLQEVGHGG